MRDKKSFFGAFPRLTQVVCAVQEEKKSFTLSLNGKHPSIHPQNNVYALIEY